MIVAIEEIVAIGEIAAIEVIVAIATLAAIGLILNFCDAREQLSLLKLPSKAKIMSVANNSPFSILNSQFSTVGSSMRKVVPRPSSELLTKILPSWYSSMMRLASESPSPQPRCFVV